MVRGEEIDEAERSTLTEVADWKTSDNRKQLKQQQQQRSTVMRHACKLWVHVSHTPQVLSCIDIYTRPDLREGYMVVEYSKVTETGSDRWCSSTPLPSVPHMYFSFLVSLLSGTALPLPPPSMALHCCPTDKPPTEE